jgi:hypothetical protein
MKNVFLFWLVIIIPFAALGSSISENLDVTITAAGVVPTENHVIIDNPPTDGSDTLEKAIADIDGGGILDVVWGYGPVQKLSNRPLIELNMG